MTKARDLANIISGSGVLAGGVIPDLPASKITSGTIASARLSLSASDIPNLDTAKITSGTLADARLSSSSVTQHVDLTALSASNLTSGTVPSARLSLGASDIPALATSKITSGTFADARLSSSSVTQYVDLSNLNASNLTSGSIPSARVASGAVTQHVSAVTSTSGSWTPGLSSGAIRSAWGYYYRIGNLIHCVGGYEMDGGSGSGDQQGAAQDTNEWYITGLPFTSNSNGKAAGGGTCYPNGRSSTATQAVVKDNSSRVYIYSPGSDGADVTGWNGVTTNTPTNYSYSGGYNNKYTNRFAHMSWNEWSRFQGSASRGWGWVAVQYYV